MILVGGFGTRLRPLTFTKPKPLIEVCNKPQLVHQIEALAAAGVDEVVLAIGYKSHVMDAFKAEYEKVLGIKITCSPETEPMGTAGPLALARDILNESEDFFVLNSDVICEFPLHELHQFHKKHGAEGTIMVTQVEDPSAYGVVVFETTGRIERFVEKPKEYISDKINSGIYCFNRRILDRIPLSPTSIEKEIFPVMASENQLFAMVLDGFWMDVGKPKDFLEGSRLFLAHLQRTKPLELASSAAFPDVTINGNVLIHCSAKIGHGAVLGPDVVIGPNTEIQPGVRLVGTTVLEGAVVKSHAWISNSIIGWDSTIGKWCRIEGVTVTGEDVQVADELFLNATQVLPHKGIKESYYEKDKIIM